MIVLCLPNIQSNQELRPTHMEISREKLLVDADNQHLNLTTVYYNRYFADMMSLNGFLLEISLFRV